MADQGNNQTDTPILFQGEREKGKWQNFSKKAFGKKGFVKKSIFKSPEEADGKVGDHVRKPVKIQKLDFLYRHVVYVFTLDMFIVHV